MNLVPDEEELRKKKEIEITKKLKLESESNPSIKTQVFPWLDIKHLFFNDKIGDGNSIFINTDMQNLEEII